MGQQQLLLIVLGAIIVGLAVVVGINMFGSSAEQANIDAVRSDVLTFASSAQAFYKKPEMLGGGGNSFVDSDGDGVDFTKVNFPADSVNGTYADNANGTYDLDVNATQVTITAHPSSHPSNADSVISAVITEGDINWQ